MKERKRRQKRDKRANKEKRRKERYETEGIERERGRETQNKGDKIYHKEKS